MNTIIKYRRLYIFTENASKSFLAEFKGGVNIIYGANTSGKSSILQSINYTFGINDEKYKLSEILQERPIFRLDIEITTSKTESVILIRDDDFIYIKREDIAPLKFSGISENNSREHIKLKLYLSELLGFNMMLNSKGKEVEAPIEAMFLPYYVAQDYGWVIPFKSFKNFDYYKGFKESYLDYYLGIIDNNEDVNEKYRLEEEKKTFTEELNILSNIKVTRTDLAMSKNNDEPFIKEATLYVEKFNENRKKLIKNEKEYVATSNELKYYEERYSVLRLTLRSINDNKVLKCPVCNRAIEKSLAEKYNEFQNYDDTINQINELKDKIKALQSKLNGLNEKNKKIQDDIEQNYAVLNKYKSENISMVEWLNNKANVQLIKTIESKVSAITSQLTSLNEQLKKFKTEKTIKEERDKKDSVFKKYFFENFRDLEVKKLEYNYSIYKTSIFPQQGVELLKTLLSYHFAFNNVIRKSANIHLLPLCLDAIFKEDVDKLNKNRILTFISKNKIDDIQILCSIADGKEDETSVMQYNKEIFSNKANLIKTGDEPRSLLREFDYQNIDILNESLEIMTIQ